LDWGNLLNIFIISLLIFVGYTVANIYVLSKLKVNRWLILGVAVAFLIIGMIVPYYTDNVVLTYVPTTIFVFFFLWFADLSGFTGFGKKKAEASKPTIKPKAKPNRIKYADKVQPKTDDKKKKK
jgi:hypothetical protein